MVLVTGCRSGFGLKIALDLAKRGHRVYAGLRDLASAPPALSAENLVAVQLDVTDPGQRDTVVQQILAENGRLDVLVNNAGVALGGFLEQVEEDELRKVFDTNVFAPWALTRAALPAMREQKAGKVLMISSVSGIMAFPGLGTYASSKFALEGLSEAWRHELTRFGIDLYLIEPGAYDTDIWGRNRALCRRAREPGPWLPYVERADQTFDAMVRRRMADPQEVVDLVARLVEGPRAGLRHPIGPGTRLRTLMKQHAPFWVLERIVGRVFFGDRLP